MVLTLTIVSILFAFTGLEKNLNTLKNFPILFAMLSSLCIFIKWVIEAIILKLSLFNESKKVSIHKSLNIVILGNFFNYLTPFYTGGQPMQIYYLAKSDIDTGFSTGAILYKSMIFQFVLAIFGLMGIIYAFKYLNIYSLIIVTLGFLLNSFAVGLIIIFAFNKKLSKVTVKKFSMFMKKIKVFKNPEKHMDRIMNDVEDFIDFFRINAKKYIRMIILTILSFLQFSFFILALILIMVGFDIIFDIDTIFRSIVLNIGASIVPTPGTSGASESFYYLAFSGKSDIFTMNSTVLIWRLSTYYFTLFIGVIIFLIKTISKKDN